MPKRTLQTLFEACRGPAPVEGWGSPRNARFWDSNGLSEAAILAALQKAGADAVASAKLAQAVMAEFLSRDGMPPSRFDQYLTKPLNLDAPHFPKGLGVDAYDRRREIYWFHQALLTAKNYRPFKALPRDLCIEVADRKFLTARLFDDGPNDKPFFERQIEGWERGGDEVVVRDLDGLFDWAAVAKSPELKAEADAARADWNEARANAVGFIRINASLAIRSAFDALHQHRHEKR